MDMKPTIAKLGPVFFAILIGTASFTFVIRGQANAIETSETNQSNVSDSDVVAELTVDPLMNSPHKLRVEATFRVQSGVSDFEIEIYNSSTFGHITTIETAEGFAVSESDNFVQLSYTEETTSPSVTYTIEKSAIQLGRGNPYPMIAGDDWMVFRHRGVTELRYSDRVSVSTSWNVKTDLPVFRGNKATLVGAHQLYNHSNAQQKFTLVVPEAADMVADPTAVLQLLDTTSKLIVRETPGERTHVFVLPDDAAGERSQGLSLSPDMFVPARSKLNQGIDGSGQAAQSVWAHEMAHVHHEFYSPNPDAPKMRWLSEGHADYIAAYASYLNGDIPFSTFYNWTQYGYSGEEESLHDDVLSDPSTHDGSTMYSKGRRVVLALDAKIRQETDGDRTVFDVFYLLIQDDAAVTLPEFKAAVKEVAGRSLESWIDEYVTTSAAPTAPRNESLFDSMPDSEIEPANYTGPAESRPPQANITYVVQPLSDESNRIHVRVTVESEQISKLTIFVENESSDGYSTDITAKAGVREEEFNRLIHLFPETNSNSLTFEYTMERSSPYPSADEYENKFKKFIEGVNFEPRDANLTEVIIIEPETGAKQTFVIQNATETPGQPGFTAVLAALSVLILTIIFRRRGNK